MNRRRLRRAGAVAVAIAFCAPAAVARADDPPAPSASVGYAGKPTGWWVRELASPRTSAVAREALRLLGDAAFPELVRALGGDDSRLRAAVAREIDAFAGDPSGFLPLVERSLRAPSPEVRLAAARLARRTGARGASLLEALVELGADTSGEIRAAVVQAIAAIGPRSTESFAVLVRAFRDQDADASRAARGVLEKVGPDTAAAVPAIVAGFQVSPNAGHETFIRALGRIGPDVPGVMDALRAARERVGGPLRSEAVRALAACASRSAAGLAEFQTMLEAGSPDRAEALREGGALPEVLRATMPAFVDALLDPEQRVRAEAAGALGRWKGPVDDWVPRLLSAPVRPDVGGDIGGVLRAWGARAVPAAAEAYPTASPETRKLLWIVFTEVARSGERAALSRHTAKFLPTLREGILAADTRPDERRGHAEFLGMLAESDPTAAAVLLEVMDAVDDVSLVGGVMRRVPAVRGGLLDRLRDGRAPVRRRALDLLSTGSLGPAELPALARLLTDPEPDVRARAGIAVMRGQGPFDRRRNPPELRVPAAHLVAALSDALRDKDVQTRVEAARSLGALGEHGRDALPLLVSALSDVHPGVAAIAGEAVARLARELEVPIEAVLAPAVDSLDGATRAAAARTLASAGGHAAAAIALLRPLLDHSEARVRSAALEVVTVLGRDAGALASRVDALQKDADPAVATVARMAMEAMRR